MNKKDTLLNLSAWTCFLASHLCIGLWINWSWCDVSLVPKQQSKNNYERENVLIWV